MDAQRLNYIKQIATEAARAAAGTNLFASVMIAQAALESGNGASVLAKKYNNHFGIKASTGWMGGIAAMPTTEYIKGVAKKVVASFRAYSSLLDGFADRINFLKKKPRYAKAGVFAAPTPEAQAKALQAAGYATDPLYSQKIISIINTYNLKQYDGMVLPAVDKKKV
ncbi:glucosaminidase domain-containing protein [Mucilaginibacter sp. ZT4R22]|uniref:Glucosaminidase domain-containing protein n=1 Tax=Mucilaginibacter pankratovii TaxID=2772110 RepID=A0ABR7WPY0_9SPHI|nr:glucosaminidase domain-containing protein [Mucilaginibacter pankratovii]MBD1364376.1 glucosaminidase domain-containing protein [Mucilaginibacter pankratovii]